MKPKRCPVCNGSAAVVTKGPWAGRISCWDDLCLLAHHYFKPEAWAALPRQDPLAAERDAVIRAVRRAYNVTRPAKVTVSDFDYIETAWLALMKAAGKRRGTRAQKS